MNAISSDGLSIQTTKNGKGQSTQTISGHPSVTAPDVVPMEFYDIDPVEGGFWDVQQILSHVTSDFEDVSVEAGEALEINLTAESTYTIETVIVLMGGEDITATAYEAGTVTIASVTGDVVVTAVATS